MERTNVPFRHVLLLLLLIGWFQEATSTTTIASTTMEEVNDENHDDPSRFPSKSRLVRKPIQQQKQQQQQHLHDQRDHNNVARIPSLSSTQGPLWDRAKDLSLEDTTFASLLKQQEQEQLEQIRKKRKIHKKSKKRKKSSTSPAVVMGGFVIAITCLVHQWLTDPVAITKQILDVLHGVLSATLVAMVSSWIRSLFEWTLQTNPTPKTSSTSSNSWSYPSPASLSLPLLSSSSWSTRLAMGLWWSWWGMVVFGRPKLAANNMWSTSSSVETTSTMSMSSSSLSSIQDILRSMNILQHRFVHYIQSSLVPSVQKNLSKMFVSEIWRRIWIVFTPDLPKPFMETLLLTATTTTAMTTTATTTSPTSTSTSTSASQSSSPSFLQEQSNRLGYFLLDICTTMADKYVKTILQKFLQTHVQDTLEDLLLFDTIERYRAMDDDSTTTVTSAFLNEDDDKDGRMLNHENEFFDLESDSDSNNDDMDVAWNDDQAQEQDSDD